MANPQVSHRDSRFTQSSFWQRKQDVVRNSTLAFQLDMLRTTGRYTAFDLKWQEQYGNKPNVWPIPNHLFFDSDVAKWIEGACYLLKHGDRDSCYSEPMRQMIQLIRGAQQPDGYLNIHFTVVEPGKRLTNLRDMHELYNAGHLIEAALAHHELYKTMDLLDPIKKYVDLLCKTFGPGTNQTHGYPGHPEIELALIRLFKETGEQRYLDLARYFLEERGNTQGVDSKHYYDVESEARSEPEDSFPQYYPARRSYWYQQAHKPILEQESIEGHSVRAMYLLTGVAVLAILDTAFKDKYFSSLNRLWSNMVDRKMYMTGGIGAMEQWEGFGIDYFLPQGTDEGGCYSETCAAIGVMMLAERLLQLDLNSKYADVLELCLYNSVLTGISLTGKAFTYVNQLASSEGHPSWRQEWFDCACCPPNMIRLIGSLNGYLWSHGQISRNDVYINVHLYSAACLSFEVNGKRVELQQHTEWPWSGQVHFTLQADPSLNITIRLRIPGWSPKWSLLPQSPSEASNGYVTLDSAWLKNNAEFELQIPLMPRLLSPHPYTNQPITAVARGPIIYCTEDVDNKWMPNDHFKSTVMVSEPTLEEFEVKDLPGGEKCVGIQAINAASLLQVDGCDAGPNLSRTTKRLGEHFETLTFIPYYARANRGGNGMMRVGIRTQV